MLLPTFGASASAFQVYVVVVVLGFIVSLVFAWIFEITPDGVRLDRNLDRKSPRKAGRVMNYAIMGLLVVALVVSMTFNVADLRTDAPLTAFAQPTMRDSIAVLPFTSRSTDAENALFADGIHDDLLTKLANTGGLKVISRTSVLEYRDTTKNLRQIGEELGVDAVLEGAVQKMGDNVRINVQLIDAKTDEHLWAKTYDRQLTVQNIFSIQSEISEAITVALETTLIASEPMAAVNIPTKDIRAYSLYVSGRDNLYLRRLETTQAAREQFEQAIALDSDYAEAYVGLAESVLLLQINHAALPTDEAFRLAQENLDIALALGPEIADAYATLGLMKTNIWSQTRVGEERLEAEAAFERAISLNPNHAQAYMWFASLRAEEQRLEDAIAYYHRSMQLDPLGRIPSSNLPTLYARLGQNNVALKLWLDAIQVHPEWPTLYGYIATHLMGMGRLDEAMAWTRAAQALSTDPTVGNNLTLGIYLQFGQLDKARALLTDMPADNPMAPFAKGFRSLIDGNFGAAHEFFSYNNHNSDQEPKFMLEIAADAALLAGDLTKAREYTLKEEPLLDNDGDLPIDPVTVRKVVKLAYIHQQTGDTKRADELLNAALAVAQAMPRQGMFGHGILDVQIYALLGRRDDAFLALNQA
ncbi:MAG: tetratricopeptide repeat protein, partial [Gammaproteobacteria bacterium]|nr:tetratricopeptide repeat protein [Gammaproteobacteria bacterium]